MKIILGERLFDLEETARMLGVRKTTISGYIGKYGLKTTIIERKKYLSEDEIRKLITPRAN